MNERLHLHTATDRIDTLIFDFGGVLLDLDPDKCRKSFHALGIHQIEEFIDRYRPKGLFYECECGNIGQETFIRELQKLAPEPVSRRELIDAYTSFLIDLPVYKLTALRQLRQQHNVYLLSNVNELCFNFCSSMFFTQEGLQVSDYFDRLYLSYRMRICKPAPEIFRMMLEDSGLDPARTLFIDDSRNNTDMADSFGINTYLALPEEDFRPLFDLEIVRNGKR